MAQRVLPHRLQGLLLLSAAPLQVHQMLPVIPGTPKIRAHQMLYPKLSKCSFKMAHFLEEQPPNLKLHMKVVHILKHIIQLFIKVGLIEQPRVYQAPSLPLSGPHVQNLGL
jgi:hypothetical protein